MIAFVEPSTRRTADSVPSEEGQETEHLGAPPPGAIEAEELPPGTRIGRYVVLRPLGSGGMGMVYLADDPELDRRVAVKILRAGNGVAPADDASRRRLRREAQAIARLSHPNVVAVFDVGSFEDGIFIAMEYVEGDSVRQWLRQRRRNLDAILEVYIAAGRGLAAAHAADIVHRDVKPDNIVVDPKLRVKVLDFGLARAVGTEPVRTTDSGTHASDDERREPLLSESMTRVGQVMGTPAYMSPEQSRGLVLTPRSDQYSYCVALFEAVFDVRPFVGNGARQLAAARERGPAFPEQARVPRALIRILSRGLAFEATQRFESMDALLRELTRLRHRKRRTALWIGLASALSGAGSFAWAQALDDDACADAGQLQGWSAQRRAAVAEAFEGTGSRLAAESWPLVEAELDAFATTWSSARDEVCHAMVDGRRSGTVLDMQRSCLDRQRHAFDALIDTLAEADLEVVAKAREAVARLPSVATCADTEALARLPPTPSDAVVRQGVEDARRRLATAAASRLAGRYDRADEALQAAEHGVEATHYEPLRAEYELERARLAGVRDERGEAEAALRRALEATERARYAGLRAEILVDLAFELGAEQKRFDAAGEVLAMAEAVAAGIGDPPDTYARRQFVQAEILLARDRFDDARAIYERLLEAPSREVRKDIVLERIGSAQPQDRAEAIEHFRQALKLREERFGPSHPEVADALVSLGSSLMHDGDLDAADRTFERALRIRRDVFGADTAAVAQVRSSLGAVAIKRQDYDAALKHLQWAVDTASQDPRAVEFDTATMISNLGIVYSRLGRQEDARQMHRRALELMERAEADHPRRSIPCINIAATYQREQNHEASIEWFQRAADILAASQGGIGRAGDMEVLTAEAYAALGDFEAARRHYRRAIDRFERDPGPTHLLKGEFARVGVAETYLEQGRPADAITWAQEALTLAQRRWPTEDAPVFVHARFALARALWEQRSDRRRAVELARLAVERSGEAGIDDARVHQIRHWLETHDR